jgi:hypothetical protein
MTETSKATKKTSVGRPKLDLDVQQIRELASIHCTMIEIAAVMRCSVDTLERNFADAIKEAKESGKASLRRAQYKKAMSGNPAMLIWLGKHLLGQKEEIPTTNYQPQVQKLLEKWKSD